MLFFRTVKKNIKQKTMSIFFVKKTFLQDSKV